jgi:toxin ParE1/3/4
LKVEFSQEATLDLEAIGDWIAQDNPSRAYSFVEELREDCFTLKDFSERNVVFKRSDLGDVRKRPYGNYVIFYVVENDIVIIARILHSARDSSDLF